MGGGWVFLGGGHPAEPALGATVRDALLAEFVHPSHPQAAPLGWPCGLQPGLVRPPRTPRAARPRPAVRHHGPRCAGFAPGTLCSRLFPPASRLRHFLSRRHQAGYQLPASLWRAHTFVPTR